MYALLVIPVALTYTFGRMVKDTRQGWAVLAAMFVLFAPLLWLCISQEHGGGPALAGLPLDQAMSALQGGGNMEGKEVRFGIPAPRASTRRRPQRRRVAPSTRCTTPSRRSAASMPMFLIQLGEVVFGGVGSGLYGMIVFAVVAVFVAGLMVGRTPEYVGKKIEAKEMKMASLAVLVPCATILVFTAIAVATESGRKGVANPGPHGFSEILYAFTASAAGNNGSAFAGLSANTPFYNTTLGLAMYFGRFFVKISRCSRWRGRSRRRSSCPQGPGRLPTHTPLFVSMLVGVVVIVGALTFIPALALGPFVEHLLATTG